MSILPFFHNNFATGMGRSITRRLLTIGLCSLVVLGTLVFPQTIVRAANTWTVVSLGDKVSPSSCSGTYCTHLRDAIAASASGDIIQFQAGLNGTIGLTAELIITHNLTISGTGATVTVSGQNAVRVFRIDSTAASITNVTFQGFTITNGFANDTTSGIGYGGGGILVGDYDNQNNPAALTLVDMTLDSNSTASGMLGGGGILSFSGSTVTIRDSAITNNSTDNAGIGGGGILNAGTDGTGNIPSSLNIVNSTISGNSSIAEDGGGIDNSNGANTSLYSATIYNNTASGANGGNVMADSGNVTLVNTIVAGGHSSSDPDISSTGGAYVSNDHNDIQNVGSSEITLKAHDKQVDPQLNALGNYGGLTKTHSLKLTSPLIDAGGSCVDQIGNALTTDQRGLGYPRVMGSACDIGAFELQTALVENVTSSAANGSYTIGAVIPINLTFSQPVVVTGTPQLTLNSSGIGSYASGSGTNTLTFDYTVALGQNSSQLDYSSVSALSLNGGTIKDTSSNPANLTLPAPGATGSLGANKSIVIDTTAPVVTAFTTTSPSSSLDIPITAFTASDNFGVTGYLVTLSATPPLATDSGWSGSAPSTYPAASDGLYSLYPWARDAAGNVSAVHALVSVTVCSSAITVASSADGGAGSLRQAMLDICPAGTITFGGNTSITLTSASLIVAKNMTIDGGSNAVNVSGSSTWGVFKVNSGVTASLNHLTITNGHANSGGGIYNDGTLTVQNSTFSANSTTSDFGHGGGIYNDGTLTVQNSTFSSNSASYDGGGIFNDETLNLSNTILADSPSSGDCVNPGSIPIHDHNLIQDGTCSPALSGNPLLGSLANNGGPTQTMALLAGSPAIDAGNGTTCLTTDQRGVLRPQGAVCDIGAFELVDAGAPDTSIDSETPSTTPTESTTMEFTFSGTDTASGVKSFECKLDAASFSACTSPQEYSSLADGSHSFQVRAINFLGTVDPTPASYTWTVDTTPPTVTVNQASGQADPTNAGPINFTAVFSQPIDPATFTATDVSLGGTATGTLAAAVTEVGSDGTTFNIAVSGMTGSGTVTASLDASVVTDLAGNANIASTSTDNTVMYDITAPIVTVNQAAGQSDPTDAGPINFTAVFSQPITPATFTAAHVSLTGTAGATTAVITQGAPNNDTTFNIAVSGLTANGTVIVSIPAGGMQDLAGNFNTASTSTDNTVTYDITDPVVVPGPYTKPANGAVLKGGITSLTVQFSKDVLHDGSAEAADNPANYLLVNAGKNGKFDTISCGPKDTGGLQPDDTRVTVDSVVYDPVKFVATLSLNSGKKLPDGRYRLFVCGTTSVTDPAGNKLNGGKDTLISFTIVKPGASSSPAAPAVPSTGFAPDVVTHLPQQPAGQEYAAMGDLWLEIPRLGVKMNIVGVPQAADGGWDVSWLGDNAGWLNGSAYPTRDGNSVLTGHVYDALGQPGPFVAMNTLWWGDQVIIHAGSAEYVYEVRSVKQVSAEDVNAMMQHEDSPWLTLVTCRGYDEASNSYLYRVLVRAVLVEVK